MSLLRRVFAPALAAAAMIVVAPAAQASPPDHAYDLPEAGVFLEGIGVDQDAQLVYATATNRDGTIYRGELGSGQLEVWVGPRAGDNGRGVAVDGAGRVYVAGGPSAEVRVFDRAGTLLAELPTGRAGSFLNDLRVGADGAVYVTDSSLPVIWRVTHQGGQWALTEWLDVSAVIAYTPALTDFDLGGIALTPDGRYLLTTQGTTGALWRIDLATREIVRVAVAGDPLVTADGIVLRGHRLDVVQNFRRQVTTLRLAGDWASAAVVAVTPTAPDRTFTTAARADGRFLAVDSKFSFTPAQAVAADRVVALDLP